MQGEVVEVADTVDVEAVVVDPGEENVPSVKCQTTQMQQLIQPIG